MTSESDAFEQLNARIARLVQGRDTSVEWNAKIPDPDSQSDQRQIDVLIQTSDGRRVSVECRRRGHTQSVMWIEELAGRKQSLGLDGMIAVSLSGFSRLAQKKAERFGIILYDFERLTDDEIASWSEGTRVETRFVQFDNLTICAGIYHDHEPLLSDTPVLCYKEKNGYLFIMDSIREDVLASPEKTRTRELDPDKYTVDGIPLTYLSCTFAGQAVDLKAGCVSVSKFGTPATPVALRNVAVESFEHSVPEIVRSGSNAYLVIDVSKLSAPSDSILHEFRVHFPDTTTVQEYELVGTRTINTPLTRVVLEVVTMK